MQRGNTSNSENPKAPKHFSTVEGPARKPAKNSRPRHRVAVVLVVAAAVCALAFALVAGGVVTLPGQVSTESSSAGLAGGGSAGNGQAGNGLTIGSSGDGSASNGAAGDGSAGDGSAGDAAQPSSEPVQIDLLAVGDVLQHTGVYQSGLQADGSYNFDHVFAHIANDLQGQDIKVLNQESVLGGNIAPYSGYPTFNGPQEMGDAEVKAGFNVILRASNHTMDMGYEGLHSELQFWKTKHPEVAVLGAVDPEDPSASIDDVYIYEKNGFKVALLNYTYDLNGFQDPNNDVSLLEEGHVRTTMQKAREQADMVVVFPHWGQEYETGTVDEQRQWEQFFILNGADVIIGGHPHVIEPVDTFQTASGSTGVCFWSLGNYISTQANNASLVCGMAKVVLQKDADGTCRVASAQLEPLITHKGSGTSMTTYPLRDYTNDLASTNALYGTSNASLTPAWAQNFCQQVLGSGYDPASCRLQVDLWNTASSTASDGTATASTTNASGTADASTTSASGVADASTANAPAGEGRLYVLPIGGGVARQSEGVTGQTTCQAAA